ncbi:hypothetical protein [Arthrobacter globiformis]|uniref:hypothetical protein n=1 Tax=Arthrobacter globiformis TaxID=1665 RepID=UPI00278B6DCD|nr:hypothetical protein [Arthrobacter globiformis]MDQ0864974.1 hypothetical protein [Arthrobacter globiformis]
MDELLLPETAAVEDLSGRQGFDEEFLGQRVPLPGLAGVETVLLPYTHFSVLMRLASGGRHRCRDRRRKA